MGHQADPLTPRIRPVTEQDAQGVADLLAVLGYPCPAEDALERIKALQQDPDQQLLVAEAQGGLLGLICYDLMYYLPLGAPTCRITALSIAWSAQRQGIGRMLVREVETRARAAGAARVELTTASFRGEAHAFYQTCGYAESALRFVKRLGD